MKKFFIILLGSFLLIVTTGVAGANLITNGSFEGEGDFSYQTLTAGSTLIPGWEVLFGSIDWIDDYWQASDGDKSIDLAGYYENGVILGTAFPTVIGQTYLVEFDMAGNPDQSYDKSLLAAAIFGELLLGELHTFEFIQDGNTHADMGWETKSFTFEAISDLSYLGFGNDSANVAEAWGAAIDNVRVTAVPEPATMFLFGTGLIVVAAFGRKRFLKK